MDPTRPRAAGPDPEHGLRAKPDWTAKTPARQVVMAPPSNGDADRLERDPYQDEGGEA
jgi:hypothetical protein